MNHEMSLSECIDRAVERSLESGALQPLATDYDLVRDGGVGFVVWRVEQIEQKEEATDRQREADDDIDPFAPPYGDLFVDDLSETHVCLLNKFNVLDRHALVVTREWEEQTEPVTRRDFEALWQCLDDLDGLGFYNGGRIAGASQPHKHLQIVDLPMVDELDGLSLTDRFEGASLEPGELGRVESLPFEHLVVRLEGDDSIARAAQVSHEHYRDMLERWGMRDEWHPHNLLVTRRWMWCVPRIQEHWKGISINALGFAGSMLVRDDEELARLEEVGPMQMLADVAEAP